MMNRYYVLLLLLLSTLSCADKARLSSKGTNAFALLKTYMSGTFNSEAQSKTDSSYFDIRLRMIPVWKNTEDVFFLYVEQAMAGKQDQPYRQRFYKVEKKDNTHFVSHIYTVNQPARLTGVPGNDPIFDRLTPDSLLLKDGCAVYLEYQESSQSFLGSTQEGTCPSDRQGASYTTSKVSIYKDRMVSWDQGWNKEGKQVWGATKGGYEFMKEQ